MVPIDQSQYIQSLFNPLSDDENPELITVQVVYPMLRENKGGLAEEFKSGCISARSGRNKNCCPQKTELTECLVVEESNDDATEGNRHKPTAVQPTINASPRLTGPQKCVYCGQETKKGKFYSCLQCCDYKVCFKCNLKYYVRKQLKNKRCLDNLYQNMELEAITNDKQERHIAN